MSQWGKEMRRDRKYMQKKGDEKNGRRIGNEGKNSNKSLFFFLRNLTLFFPSLWHHQQWQT
jgi:hypothetical protein